MSTTPAPIALFVYNRPDHVLRTVSALHANPLARHSVIYVFSDGPNGSADIEKVEAVRQVVKRMSGFGKVCIREQPQNLGLAKSIVNGVTEVVAA